MRFGAEKRGDQGSSSSWVIGEVIFGIWSRNVGSGRLGEGMGRVAPWLSQIWRQCYPERACELANVRTHRKEEKSTRRSGFLFVANPTSEGKNNVSTSRITDKDDLVRRYTGTNELSVD